LSKGGSVVQKVHKLADTATPDRNERRRLKTRQTLLSAADRVFRSKGVDATTVNEITEEADVAYGSFYNHFKSIDEIVSALAADAIQRVADRTGEILSKAQEVELLPCVGARVVIRTLANDPAIRWLLGRPYILVDEFRKIARPFMIAAERDAVRSGRLKPAGGHETWLRTYPWILISELNDLLETGNIEEHEDRFARISLRFLGIDDGLAPKLIETSRKLIPNGELTEPKDRRQTKSRKR
jgi:AcrR family transcriptional regulator